MIQAVIFDMDGLLIDSEPLWQEAEKNSFREVGIYLTTEQTTQTTGLHVDEVVEYWYIKYPWDLNVKSKQEVSRNIVEDVKRLIKKEGQPKKGVKEILNFISGKTKNIAIASSSEYSIIHEVVYKLGIRDFFSLIYSAEEEKYGKPHPEIYISACKKLGYPPEQCITFEDSFNGVLSAKSAKVNCIAVPEDINKNNPKFVIADQIIDSLDKFDDSNWYFFNKKN